MLFWLFLLAGVTFWLWRKKKTSSPICNHRDRAPLAASRDHAVVIGAGIGGLLSARILSQYFRRVTVIDRDSLPDDPAPRRGTPQSDQLHTMLVRGATLTEVLFPGITNELKAAGARVADYGSDIAFYFREVFAPRLPKNSLPFQGVFASRAMWEYSIRRRLLEVRNVTILDKTTATRILTNKDGEDEQTRQGPLTVTGVEIRSKQSGSDLETLQADFVVDCSGRKTRSEKWLSAMGVPAIPKEEVNSKLGYCSGIVEVPEGRDHYAEKGWEAFISTHPTVKTPEEVYRTAIVLPTESPPGSPKRYLIAFLGMGGDYPPVDKEALIEWAEGGVMHSDVFVDVLKNYNQIGEFHAYHDGPSCWRHFENLPPGAMPEHYVCLGDVIASFNPTFGQGMTHAALHASALDKCFREHLMERPFADLCGLAAAIQKAAAVHTSYFWAVCSSEDLGHPATIGKRTTGTQIQRLLGYTLFMESFAARDNYVLMLKLQNGLAGMDALLAHPMFIIKVLVRTARVLLAKRKGEKLPPPCAQPAQGWTNWAESPTLAD